MSSRPGGLNVIDSMRKKFGKGSRVQLEREREIRGFWDVRNDKKGGSWKDEG